MAFNYYCVDAGSDYCPCHLAEIDSCLICSMLQGQEVCDCMWQGVCVYSEFYWNGLKPQNKKQKILAKITARDFLTETLLILKVYIDSAQLIRECNQPGTFVFARNPDSGEFYDVPLCVMNVDEQKKELQFAVNVIGPKTRNIAKSKDNILLRLPYWNGLFGLKHIKSSYKKNWLVIGRGTSQVSLILTVKNLLRGENNITVLLDPGFISLNLAEAELKKMGINPEYFDFQNTFHTNRLKEMITNGLFDFIYSGGSDLQHKLIQKKISDSDFNIPLIISNNNQLCCGEGVCGSCDRDIQGKQVHLCKMQLDSNLVLGGNKSV